MPTITPENDLLFTVDNTVPYPKLVIVLDPSLEYDCEINWGDGSNNTIINSNLPIPTSISHLFPYAGSVYEQTYGRIQVRVSGTCPKFGLEGQQMVASVENLGNVGLQTDNMFKDCAGLTSVNIGDNITTIGDYTFYACTFLTSIVIPSQVTSIGGSFWGCARLEYLRSLAAVAPSFKNNIFYGTKLTQIEVPIGSFESYDTGGSQYFNIAGNGKYGQLDIVEVGVIVTPPTPPPPPLIGEQDLLFTVDNSVGYPKLKVVLDPRLRYDCEINWGDGSDNTIIVGYASEISHLFPYAGSVYEQTYGRIQVRVSGTAPKFNLEGQKMVASVENLGNVGLQTDNMFRDCTSLTSVNIGDNITNLGDYTFYKCTFLTSIVIPSQVTDFGGVTFWGCARLESIRSLAAVAPSFKANLFYGTKLTEIEVPIGSFESYDTGGSDQFNIAGNGRYGQLDIVEADVVVTPPPPPPPPLIGEQDLLFIVDTTVGLGIVVVLDPLLRYDCEINWGDGSDIERFVGYASEISHTFINVFGLVRVRVSGTAPKFGLEGQQNVVTVENLGNVGLKMDYMFKDCTGLTNVNIGDNITDFGTGAFYQCSGLTSFIIPSRVTDIGAGTFYNCINLNSFKSLAVVAPSYSPNVFTFIKATEIEVPIGSFESYSSGPDIKYAGRLSVVEAIDTTTIISSETENTPIGTVGPYVLEENDRTWVSENIDNISYIEAIDSNLGLDSATRILNPEHFEFTSLIEPISIILSNLSSLHAELAHSYYSGDLTFEQVTSSARNDMNSFFNDSLPTGFDSFDIESLIDVTGFSDSFPGEAEYLQSGQLIKNTNHYINTNYNFLVKSLRESDSTISNQLINRAVADEIKGYSSSAVSFENVFTTSSFIESIANKLTIPNADNVAANFTKTSSAGNDLKDSTIQYYPITSPAEENEIMLFEPAESDIFDTVSSFYVPCFSGYVTETIESFNRERSLVVSGFSETQVNQNYNYTTSNNGKMSYLSEDGRFELAYATTGGSNPTVTDITETFEYDEDLTFSLGHYEITLSGLDYGVVYEIEFDNITTPFNNGRKIYKVAAESDENLAIELYFDTVTDIPEKYEFTLLNEGINQWATLRLQTTDWIQNTDGLTNSPFSFSNIKSLKAQKYLNDDENLNWVLRSTDIRTNFQASMSSSITNPGGGYRLNLAIDDTENLIFDIEAIRSLGDDWEVFEASVEGSSETITRSYLISELDGYQFFRINTYFAAIKNRYFYPVVGEERTPESLQQPWTNLSTLEQENVSIIIKPKELI